MNVIKTDEIAIICEYIQSAGMQAIDEIVPTLLHALEDNETSDTALDGLKQILRFDLYILTIKHCLCCLSGGG